MSIPRYFFVIVVLVIVAVGLFAVARSDKTIPEASKETTGDATLIETLTEHDESTTATSSTVTIGGVEVIVEIADTPEGRRQGLSGRTSLPEDTGMLFVFPEDGQYGFWMRDMHFAIDIVWLSSEGEVVYLVAGASPESFPEIFQPDTPARFVLEVPAGFTEKHNIVVGTYADISITRQRAL